MFDRKPSPVNCDLAKIDIKKGRSANTTKTVSQMDRSDVYNQVLSLFEGNTSGMIGPASNSLDMTPSGVYIYSQDNFETVYRKLGGTWSTTEQAVEGRALFSAVLGCRREAELLREEGANGDAWYYSSEDAVNNLTKLAKGKIGRSICSTCPYKGMSPVEADEYEARANRAEAERLESERLLSTARSALETHLKELGIEVDDGSGVGDQT